MSLFVEWKGAVLTCSRRNRLQKCNYLKAQIDIDRQGARVYSLFKHKQIVIIERHITMISICKVASFLSGTPQFRIAEDMSDRSPLYCFYAQADLESDLRGLPGSPAPKKQIRTFDSVVTASTGDVVFSLLSGTAAIVRAEHNGYLLTQNYVVIAPANGIDARYLVYMLNECRDVRNQLRMSQQGSATMKYTLKQLKELRLPRLPSQERQRLIGELYLDQLRLHELRKRASGLETVLVLETLREADGS